MRESLTKVAGEGKNETNAGTCSGHFVEKETGGSESQKLKVSSAAPSLTQCGENVGADSEAGTTDDRSSEQQWRREIGLDKVRVKCGERFQGRLHSRTIYINWRTWSTCS